VPEIKTSLGSLKDPDAAKLPLRQVVPEGKYDSVIMKVDHGVTKTIPPLTKISVEFQIIKHADGADGADACKGRRVWQDFVLENAPDADPFMVQLRRRSLVQLLEAASCAYTEEGFNTDHLLGRTVKITVIHRKGSQPGADGSVPTFANVREIDMAEKLSEDNTV
jgi:hypothetical protein